MKGDRVRAPAPRARRNGRQVRSTLRERLEARRAEIEAAVLTRVKAIADPEDVADPAYVEGLRWAVSSAVEYGLEAIVHSDRNAPPVPVAMLAQARLAARNGIRVDTVLRRYSAGYSLLGYFVIEEASNDGLMSGPELQRLVGTQAGIFDRLLEAIGEEHARETRARHSLTGQRQAEQIERLLAGELVDTSEIAYDFDGWHLGVVAAGAEAEAAVRRLAGSVDCRLILLSRAEGALWAWLGARRRLDPENLLRQLTPGRGGADLAIALGDPAEGLSGWRLTHRQAAAALPVARRSPNPAIRYADVVLLASALQDDLLATSLRCLYLKPLQEGRHGSQALLETLRAYFLADRNVTSTAAALGVNRSTVKYRLQTVEDRIGRPLGSCEADLRTAVELTALGESPRSPAP